MTSGDPPPIERDAAGAPRRAPTAHGYTALPSGTKLDNRYTIQSVIAAGGFGIAYIASHDSLGRTFAIKEHFPRQFAYRDGATSQVRATDPATFAWALDRFLQEGRSLAECKHPNVVDVTDVFEGNGTAYMVLVYEQGQSLKSWLDALGRPPSQAELDAMLGPLFDALAFVHRKGLLHRDIAPDNIMVRRDGQLCLIDFGAARQAMAQRSQLMSAIVKSGFSPLEQYTSSGKAQGPWSDIYALGATLYRAVTGHIPPEATERVSDDTLQPSADMVPSRGDYRPAFLSAIDASLRLKQADRPQSVDAWRSMMFQATPAVRQVAASVVAAEPNAVPRVEPIVQRPPAAPIATLSVARRPDYNLGLWAMVASAAVVILGGAVYVKQARPTVQIEADARRTPPDANVVRAVPTPPKPPTEQTAANVASDVARRPDSAARDQLPATNTTIPRLPWNASATDIAAWRLKKTTRLGGALSKSVVSLDRATVAVTGGRDGSVHVLDALTLTRTAKVALTTYEPYSLHGVALLPNQKNLVVGRAGALNVLDFTSSDVVQTESAVPGYTTGSFAISRDGARVFFIRSSISPQRSTIAVYAISGNQLVPVTEYAFDVRIDSFDVSADGTRFILGTYPANELVLYDAANRREIWSQACQCSGRFAADDTLIAFAGRPGAAAGNFGATSSIGVLAVADPAQRSLFDTRTTESIDVEDVSPDGKFAAIGSTNNGQVTIIPVTLENLRPIVVLKDRSGQSISGAKFVGGNALVTFSGDNNARLWGR